MPTSWSNKTPTNLGTLKKDIKTIGKKISKTMRSSENDIDSGSFQS